MRADAQSCYDAREEQLTAPVLRDLERRVVLSVLDRKWREHLYEMDYLQEGIGLRAMAQRDPLVEYQREGYQLFVAMTDAIKEESVGYLFSLQVQPAPQAGAPAVAPGFEPPAPRQQLQYTAPTAEGDVEVHAGDASSTDAPGGNRAQRRAAERERGTD